MPNLEDFLGKSKRKFEGWQVIEGNYGCQQCDEDVDFAFFSEDALTMVWVCSNNHESKIEIG